MNKIIIIILIILFGCEQISQINKLTNYNSKICSKQSSVLNGYYHTECIRGGIFFSNYYYKIVFITKSHGMFVTKYAYSMAIGSNHSSTKKSNADIIIAQDAYRVINIYSVNEKNNLVNEILNNLGDEYLNYYCECEKKIAQSYEVYLSEKQPILYLTKSDYISFMNEHPETRIINY